MKQSFGGEILGKTVFLGYNLLGSVKIHSQVQKCTKNMFQHLYLYFLKLSVKIFSIKISHLQYYYSDLSCVLVKLKAQLILSQQKNAQVAKNAILQLFQGKEQQVCIKNGTVGQNFREETSQYGKRLGMFELIRALFR